ncbi:MAG: hypothetical protein U1C73_15560 [Dietzia sp.]|nr:hypothetical protein [Dietzia sp.]
MATLQEEPKVLSTRAANFQAELWVEDTVDHTEAERIVAMQVGEGKFGYVGVNQFGFHVLQAHTFQPPEES